MAQRIKIASPQELVALDYARLKETARTVLDGEGKADSDIVLAFVDNPTSAKLNEQFLKHDGPTDVLSFPYSDPSAKKLAGELVIGVEVAQAQAQERGHDLHAELALYVIHGLLHLCGYDDHEDDHRADMRAREQHYLALLKLPPISGD